MGSLTPSWPAPCALGGAYEDQRTTPAWARRLLFFFAVYLAVPFLEVPLFGLSVSSPVFCFLALDCVLKPVAWRPYRKWILMAALFFAAHLFSLSANVLSGRLTEIRLAQVFVLTRLAYWMLVFVITALLVHRFRQGPDLAKALGAGAILLGLLRLAEASLFGHWGGGNPQFLTQNDYGFGFSAFTPFAVWLALTTRGWKRALAAGGSLALLIAVIGNGSRSSWITVGLGLLLLSVLWRLSRSRGRRGAFAAPMLLAAAAGSVLWFAPSSLRSPVVERAATLETLDHDKPFQARQLLIRKGLALFRESPLFGAGAGSFTQTTVPLEIPRTLSYRSLEEFNRKSPHNAYIKVLAETGIFGAASLLGLLVLLSWQGLSASLALSRGGETWAIPVFVGFLTMSIHFWTLSGLTGTAPWFLYGMLAGIVEIRRTWTAGSVWFRGGMPLSPRME